MQLEESVRRDTILTSILRVKRKRGLYNKAKERSPALDAKKKSFFRQLWPFNALLAAIELAFQRLLLRNPQKY